jgi:hypothetical protein
VEPQHPVREVMVVRVEMLLAAVAVAKMLRVQQELL